MSNHAFQQRVINEQSDLNVKIMNLSKFIDGPIFVTLDSGEQERLRTQLKHMNAYNNVLKQRMESFNV